MSCVDANNKPVQNSRCQSKPSTDIGTQEGQWVGVGVALWIVLVIIAWLIRICLNPIRRQRLLNKLGCFGKDENLNINAEATAAMSPPCVYYVPDPPPSYEEVMLVFQLPQYKDPCPNCQVDDREQPSSQADDSLQPDYCATTVSYNHMPHGYAAVSLSPIQEETNEPSGSQ